MGANDNSAAGGAAWLHPEQRNDLRRYAGMLWRHRWLILICTLIGTALAVTYVKTTKRVYSAEADLFISPVSSADTATLPLGLITASQNPTGDIETAARLVTTIDTARAVRAALAIRESPQHLLNKINAQPLAQSNIVTVSAQAGTARNAARLANTWVDTVVSQRTTAFQAQLQGEIVNLRSQLATIGPTSAGAGVLRTQLAQLRAFLAAPLPDMRVSTAAVPPSSPSSPRVFVTIIGGVIGGLVVGLLLTLLLESVDVRVRGREQLRSLLDLPVLGLIPREGHPERGVTQFVSNLPLIGFLLERRRVRKSIPRTPAAMSPAALESYRTLRATLLASRPQLSGSRSILVTSASPGEGKTTTAINLAFSLATAGQKVILIEADLRRPSVGKALRVDAPWDIADVLTGEISLADALLESLLHGSNLRYLLAPGDPEPSMPIGDALLRPAAASLLSESLRLADFVVVDAPPLAEVIDALELARLVDDVLVVVRLGQTRVPRLLGLGELLARTGIKPAGIALIGVDRTRGYQSYAYGYASYVSRSSVKAPPPDERGVMNQQR